MYLLWGALISQKGPPFLPPFIIAPKGARVGDVGVPRRPFFPPLKKLGKKLGGPFLPPKTRCPKTKCWPKREGKNHAL